MALRKTRALRRRDKCGQDGGGVDIARIPFNADTGSVLAHVISYLKTLSRTTLAMFRGDKNSGGQYTKRMLLGGSRGRLKLREKCKISP